MNAVILLNKPKGMTSFSAARKCGRLLHEKKAGHTGTLDPDATGLLIVLLGHYTKLAPYAVHDHKTYEASFQLGMATDTGDIFGKETDQQPWHEHRQEELDRISTSFIGHTQQIPPMYSALRHEGKHLYELAREGREVERKPRDIFIDELHVEKIRENQYHMHARVSSGTYIRTLISDYAAKMGEIACMTSLERTGIENLNINEAADFDAIEQGKGRIDPIDIIDPSWSVREIEDPSLISDGKKVHLDIPEERVIFTFQKRILAAYEKEEDGLLHCVRGLE